MKGLVGEKVYTLEIYGHTTYGINDRCEVFQGQAGKISENDKAVEVVLLDWFTLSLHKVHGLRKRSN